MVYSTGDAGIFLCSCRLTRLMEIKHTSYKPVAFNSRWHMDMNTRAHGNQSVQRLINKTPYFPNCQQEPERVTYLEDAVSYSELPTNSLILSFTLLLSQHPYVSIKPLTLIRTRYSGKHTFLVSVQCWISSSRPKCYRYWQEVTY